MERTIFRHLNMTATFEKAVIDAYEWVAETGGTLIFHSKSLYRRGFPAVIKKCGKQRVREAIDEGQMHIEIAYGGGFMTFGPRVAMFDCTDLDLERAENSIDNEGSMEQVSELRCYSMTHDEHPKWTNKYKPEEFGPDES